MPVDKAKMSSIKMFSALANSVAAESPFYRARDASLEQTWMKAGCRSPDGGSEVDRLVQVTVHLHADTMRTIMYIVYSVFIRQRDCRGFESHANIE